jgi:TonB-linked SusC/RagA family outer membrane protein
MTYLNILNKWMFLPIVLCLTHFALPVSSQEIQNDEALQNDSVLLKYLDRNIDLGFINETKKNIVGAVSGFNPQDVIKYDHTQSIRSAMGNGRLTGLRGGDNIRGMGSALIIVDGIPGRSIDVLNMEEVESITVLKDANAAALYGSMARNGVIIITTKRGEAGNNGTNVSVNYGLRQPLALPQYLNSSDYMTAYNQAYKNDGRGDFRYDPELEIPLYRDGLNPIKYPDVDFFGDEFLKSSASYTNVLTEFYGGSKETQYYVNLGFNRSESILNLDDEKGDNRFNVRGNVDFKVNNWIKSSLDAVAIIYTSRNNQVDFWNSANSFRPNLYAPLLPVSMINFADYPELKGIVDGANNYNGHILGGTRAEEGNTPFGDIYAKGYRRSVSRVSQVNNSIDFDLSGIAKGLSARTYVSFDFYNAYNVKVTNKYSVYQPTWSGDEIVGLERLKDADRKDQKERVSTDHFAIRYGFYGVINYDKKLNDNHSVNTSLIGFINNTFFKDEKQSDKNSHAALNLRYDFKNKILADFSGAYINSIKLAEGNRGALSPTFGLGYILSEDVKVPWIDFLKIKASAGIIMTDIGMRHRVDDEDLEYYLYSSVYAKDWNEFAWGQSNTNSTTKFSRGQNLDLEAERRKDLNIGFESILFDKFSLEGNLFQTDFDGRLTLLNVPYPSYYRPFRPYGNYNADRYKGFELGTNYMEDFGDFSFNIGARLLYTTSERLKVDEIYENPFQYRKGKPVDAIFGHTSIGFYEVSDFDAEGNLLDDIPVPQYGKVKPGDIKYFDKDDNGKINDQDMHQIGLWNSPWYYGGDITIKFKNLTLLAVVSGETGGNAQKNGSYYRPQGNDKYSEVVRGAWTEETAATATFPRLTTGNNDNNFGKTSTFWQYSKSSFSINRVQLTYGVPQNMVKDFSVFVAGSNLATFAKHKAEIELRPGREPMYRFYTAGVRVTF